MIEPNCDMPWEVYLDWLEDQGIGDLRFIDPSIFSMSGEPCALGYHTFADKKSVGCGNIQSGCPYDSVFRGVLPDDDDVFYRSGVDNFHNKSEWDLGNGTL
jgi:hypothetical protein